MYIPSNSMELDNDTSFTFCFWYQILSMIEEAAGTRLYESKKEAAQRTIEKKDAKLKEIDTVSAVL